MQRCAFPTTLGLALGLAALFPAVSYAGSNVVLWDTVEPLNDAGKFTMEGSWRVVPEEIFSLEKDPAKAASDPGYYGREYRFNGDAVVANRSVTVVFSTKQGRVGVFAKPIAPPAVEAVSLNDDPGRLVAKLVPVQLKSGAAGIKGLEVVRNTGDEVALAVTFAGRDSETAAATFVFDRSGIVEVQPGEGFKGINLAGAVDYAVVPSFVGDDLIYGRGKEASTTPVSVPPENALLALAQGGDAEVMLTWPAGKQRVTLIPGDAAEGSATFSAIDFSNPGQSFYLSALRAPEIWHREKLGAAYLEQDVASEWKRPFAARWKTELPEEKVRTSYKFREGKGEIWRGVPGSYTYPVWFEGDVAKFHLGKKVSPKGEAIIYFLEGDNSPAFVPTPADMIKSTLGRPAAEMILDYAGRELRTHHRRADADVHRSCTCGYTEAIQALFEKNQEVAKKDEVEGSLEDMVYFVQSHVNRINEYRKFADGMAVFLKDRAADRPELKTYLDHLAATIHQIPEEYEVQKDNMKSMSYAADLVHETMALTGKLAPNNLEAYMDLLKRWRGMGGSQDYLVARCHMITRQFAQEAGYGCAGQPAAVATAMEIREHCKQILRHPDGYEIWTDY